MTDPKKTHPSDTDIRPHTFDGIQEFNHRLPNWWLFTLYGAVVFWLCYWSYYQWFHEGPDDRHRIQAELVQVEAAKLAAMASSHLDNASLWAMSRNPVIVASGRKTFEANCTPCHLASLRGRSENKLAIGPDLTVRIWIHGGHPIDLYHTVTQGVPAKGMPTWGPILGPRRITEAVAYVLSHHQEGEPIIDAATLPPGSK